MKEASLAPELKRRLSLLDSLGDTASHQNAMLLIQLRWLAVFGQAFTIVVSSLLFDLQLPLVPMFSIVIGLILLNLYSLLRPREGRELHDRELMIGLFVDITALSGLLYFSGGAENPFVFLFVMQVALGGILLQARRAWMLALWSMLSFALLTRWFVPLQFASEPSRDLFALHVDGMMVCYVLDVVLLMLFMVRITANLRQRDRQMADLRQQAAEEDHIVRMGLLASGAAHELGTPLATLSVIVGDWRHLPEFRDHPERKQELEDVESELRRIKSIVSGILISSGEARGESTEVTTLADFVDQLVAEWRRLSPQCQFELQRSDSLDVERYQNAPIVAGPALRQTIFNVLDNARYVSPAWIQLTVHCDANEIVLGVRDRGPGLEPAMIESIGKPYRSTKNRPGSGLGLFLVVNVLRKLGGSVEARNLESGGAEVQLRLPFHALAIDPEVESAS